MIQAEGANGQLPNLDLINTVYRITQRYGIGENRLFLFDKPTIPLSIFPTSIKTLINFMVNQAVGIPTGDHGIFNMYLKF